MTREQFEIIRPDLENAKIFQVGNWFITQCGQSLMKTVGQNFKLVERFVVVIFKLLLSSPYQKVSKIRTQPKKKALMLVKKFSELNLLSIF